MGGIPAEQTESTSNKGGWISDPVHSYDEFTSLERDILDHRVTQRLRYISQAGLAHLVFPEVRTSRFSHCLGAMHLASAFLRSCLQNSGQTERVELARALTAAAEKHGGSIVGTTGPDGDEATRILEAQLFAPSDGGVYPAAIAVAEQAVRLAALFHDLGHLPFSHDFESALTSLQVDPDSSQWLKSVISALRAPLRIGVEIDIHEKLGHQLALIVLREINVGRRQEASQYINNVSEFAFEILTMASVPYNVEQDRLEPTTAAQRAVVFLHGLVSGELDVDRCDYLLRDGRNYGFDFATYDLDRLLMMLVVAISDDGELVLAVRPQGLSSVESFLLSRSRSYQFGVRHHKVTQGGSALQYSMARIVIILTLNPTGQGTVNQFLGDLLTLAEMAGVGQLPNTPAQRSKEKRLLDRFAEYDDVWWTGVMRDRLRQLQHQLDEIDVGGEQRDEHNVVRDEHEWLALVCRRARGPRSLWKRPPELADHLRDAGVAQGEGLTPVTAWNERLAEMDEADDEKPWAEAVVRLASQGVLVVRHRFNPWSVDDREQSKGLYVQIKRATLGVPRPTLMAVSTLSPLATALPEAWKSDVQVHAFATSRAARTWDAKRVISELSAAMSEAIGRKEDRGEAEGSEPAATSTTGEEP